MNPNRPITRLLSQWRDGDRAALDEVIGLVYDDLREIAGRAWRRESRRVTIEPELIVHEAYLRLLELDSIEWRDRSHFMAMAARVVRRILVDQARARGSAKRSGGTAVTLSNLADPSQHESLDLFDFHEALDELTAFDEEGARIVELRIFGGLTAEEIAAELELSLSTVKRRWRMARAWLYQRLRPEESSDEQHAPDDR
jgi:RNA polymerase sigma factor (TIGR02999 family)